MEFFCVPLHMISKEFVNFAPTCIRRIYMADINRIKVILVEKKKTNKWLADQIGKDQATVSKWCTNTTQPSLDTLVEIARILEVDVRELLVPTDAQKIMMTVL